MERLKARIAEFEGGAEPIVRTGANSGVSPSRNPTGVPRTQSRRKFSDRKTGGCCECRGCRGCLWRPVGAVEAIYFIISVFNEDSYSL